MSETTGPMNNHSHFSYDANCLQAEKGLRVSRASFFILLLVGIIQAVIVYFSKSAALFGDTLHNFVDAFSAVPLWIAFMWGRRRPTSQFTYGFSRFEDLAGMTITLFIFAMGTMVAFDSFNKFTISHVPEHLPWVIVGALIGFAGNELVARYRIKAGKEINSVALVADGRHARADALTSLGVLLGAIGVYAGFPWADPLIGFVIALVIFRIGWDVGKELVVRLADAVRPGTVKAIEEEARKVEGVRAVHDIRARYVGRHLRLELTVEVEGELSVLQGHEISIKVQHALQRRFSELLSPTIHVDPSGHTGEGHHFVDHHRHGQ